MQIFHVKYEKKERCNMSYMVCHGMKSKAGDIKNIEKHIERTRIKISIRAKLI